MDNVNDLTLQLLLNQKNYNKLVKHRRTEICQENQGVDKVKENKTQIIDTIAELINGNVDDLNNAIILAFDDFTNELFKHWEMLKIKDVNKFNETTLLSDDNDSEDDSSIQSSKTDDSGKDIETTSVWSSEKVLKMGK